MGAQQIGLKKVILEVDKTHIKIFYLYDLLGVVEPVRGKAAQSKEIIIIKYANKTIEK